MGTEPQRGRGPHTQKPTEFRVRNARRPTGLRALFSIASVEAGWLPLAAQWRITHSGLEPRTEVRSTRADAPARALPLQTIPGIAQSPGLTRYRHQFDSCSATISMVPITGTTRASHRVCTREDGRVVAVQPKPSFLPFFETQREEATGATGVKYGSDGTRIRE